MKHPPKWRETINPYELSYKNFTLTDVVGYPHAGNDVFQVKGTYQQQEIEAFIKVARQSGADIANEIETISRLNCPLAPQIIDFDDQKKQFVVTVAKQGERLSTIVGDNADRGSLEYLYEYGQALPKLHGTEGCFPEVKDRPFFHIPDRSYFEEWELEFVYDFLITNQPKKINRCFCHGDFHYANIPWCDKHISAILDFELSGRGDKEFDIAWALVRRPGQKFLNTKEEISLFMDGYLSVGTCNRESVEYYMVLIYSFFYKIGKEESGYQEYIRDVFLESCNK